jgi:hypothetical protein
MAYGTPAIGGDEASQSTQARPRAPTEEMIEDTNDTSQPRQRLFAGADLERTSDLDVFVDRLNSAYYPARVTPLDATHKPTSEITALRMTHLTLGLARPGADLDVNPGALGSTTSMSRSRVRSNPCAGPGRC